MKIIRSLSESIILPNPVMLTVGVFDGVHLGHQKILNKLNSIAENENSQSAVLTFENHPSEVLRPDHPVPFILTLKHRIRLLEESGIDLLILLPFTKEFSKQSAEAFLHNVHSHIPFSHIVLGYDAVIGKDKSGNRETVLAIAKEMNCQAEYLDPYTFEGAIISSSRIRGLIQQGDFSKIKLLLGRKYSIYGPVVLGRTHGKNIGYRTANIDVSHLCLPPIGVYAVQVMYQNKVIDAVANLGMAPTMRDDNKILLEAHLFDWDQDLYGQCIEVVFCQYIRPERKFVDISQLREQIQRDISAAKQILSVTAK